MNPSDAREVLGLGQRFTIAELQQAYRDVALTAHPDMGGDDAAMANVNAARDALERFAVSVLQREERGQLTISAAGDVVGPGGLRLGSCGSVAKAVAFCERSGWDYELSKELAAA